MIRSAWLTSSLLSLISYPLATASEIQASDTRFAIDVPPVVLTDVPVERVVVTALTSDGDIDTNFNRAVSITGIVMTEHGRPVALPSFHNGVLELTSDLAEGRKVFVASSQIVVAPDGPRRTVFSIPRTQRWLSLVPPLLAIVLAIWLRNIIASLFAGVWSGAVILAHGNVFVGLVRTLDTYLIEELVQPQNPGHDHMMILLFTMFLGAMVGVMSRSGGTLALVSRLTRFTQKREHGQLMAWALGMAIFFDDYANTLFVGSTMRPVTDRLRISREKLAFLVDSTAAPVAGLAVVSTWVGVEISYIADTYARLGIPGDAYTTFLATIPYRFYPLHLLAFVLLIAYTGRDFGSMFKAEARAFRDGHVLRPGTTAAGTEDSELSGELSRRPVLRNALLPLVVLLAFMTIGLWWSGTTGLEAANQQARHLGQPESAATLWTLLDQSNPTRVLFLSSFMASIAAVAVAVLSKSLTFAESLEAWTAGAKSMFLALLILVMAWAVATLCDADHLNTSGFLVELATGRVSVTWMPALAFVLAASVSFATGSSWSTMALLMPLFISVTFYLLVPENAVDPRNPLMLGTIGGILAGAIFGDHCSPISDTTILSSAAAGSDHIDHVTTQLPYAATVAAVALFLGYIPVGLGYSPLVLLPAGLLVVFLLVRFWGRPVDESPV